jgi:hypothetical protein
MRRIQIKLDELNIPFISIEILMEELIKNHKQPIN